ncbi:MAG: hypothetical protein EXS13_00470 [Planctomycetes bacterium]|nr:hypothetical protein [Planctomycetota bacterium]
MADGLREQRPQRWPAVLVLIGVSGMVPVPVLEHAHGLIEAVAWSVRGLVDPVERTALAASEVAAPPDLALALDPRVVSLLETIRRRVLPPPARGWQREGHFGVVLVGAPPVENHRDEARELVVQTAAPVPSGEPAFFGEQLIGFTRVHADGSARIERITRPGGRTTACVGAPGEREARCLALGDGSTDLRVAYADGGVELREGDRAWAVDPPGRSGAAAIRVVGGALLGRLVRGELPTGAARDEWRIVPPVPVESLAEVAIRFPAGFAPPGETDIYPFTVTLAPDPLLDRRRSFCRIDRGREAGVLAGAAISNGGALIGRVERSGYGAALVRTLRDPGFRMRALLLQSGTAVAFDLVARGDRGGFVEIAPPPCPGWEGALVVTAASPDGTPEGLLFGALERHGDRCELLAAASAVGPAAAWRLPGAWGADR